jgi:hypothetical protein
MWEVHLLLVSEASAARDRPSNVLLLAYPICANMRADQSTGHANRFAFDQPNTTSKQTAIHTQIRCFTLCLQQTAFGWPSALQSLQLLTCPSCCRDHAPYIDQLGTQQIKQRRR